MDQNSNKNKKMEFDELVWEIIKEYLYGGKDFRYWVWLYMTRPSEKHPIIETYERTPCKNLRYLPRPNADEYHLERYLYRCIEDEFHARASHLLLYYRYTRFQHKNKYLCRKTGDRYLDFLVKVNV